MIGNIFSNVGHGAIGAHNHLGVFVGTVFILTVFILTVFILTVFILTVFILTVVILTTFILTTFDFSSVLAFGCLPFRGLRPRSPLHHPAAFVLALGLKVKHALLLQLLKRRLPEMQMK